MKTLINIETRYGFLHGSVWLDSRTGIRIINNGERLVCLGGYNIDAVERLANDLIETCQRLYSNNIFLEMVAYFKNHELKGVVVPAKPEPIPGSVNTCANCAYLKEPDGKLCNAVVPFSGHRPVFFDGFCTEKVTVCKSTPTPSFGCVLHCSRTDAAMKR